MTKILFSLALALIFFPGSMAHAAEQDTILKSESLERLNEAANFFMSLSDGTLASKDACNVTHEKARTFMTTLNYLIDKKRDELIGAQKAGANISEESWATECEKTCRCGMYASILETIGFDNLSDQDRRAYRKTSNLAMNQANVLSCAVKSDWICKSPLLNYLKSHSSEESSEEGL